MKWEYKVVIANTEENLNSYGKEGWELILWDAHGEATFKRPLPDQSHLSTS